LNFEPKPVLAGWASDPQVKSAELDRLLNRAGWHYFFVPPEVLAYALGFNNMHALSRALRKLMIRAQAERLNALQITTMRTKKFLGLHYAARICSYPGQSSPGSRFGTDVRANHGERNTFYRQSREMRAEKKYEWFHPLRRKSDGFGAEFRRTISN